MTKTFLLLTTCALAMGVQAATINLDSSAANTSNNSGNPTLNIDPNPQWSTALTGSYWVSDAKTGNPADPGYTVVPNGTDVLFSQNFNLQYAATAATLTVMADDTTSVVLNGFTIFPADTNPVGGFPRCSAQPIGCLTTTQETFTLAELSPYLKTGKNTISFDVVQENYVSFGLDYAGTITTAPEPASLAMIGGGLVFLALASRRLRVSPTASERESVQSQS